MVFAIDGKDHVGHGVGANGVTALMTAKQYWGQHCLLGWPDRYKRCMALSQSFEIGYYVGIGTAPDRQDAITFASGFCAKSRSAASCKLAYSYCLAPAR